MARGRSPHRFNREDHLLTALSSPKGPNAAATTSAAKPDTQHRESHHAPRQLSHFVIQQGTPRPTCATATCLGQANRRESWETHWSGWRRKREDVNKGVGVEFEVLFEKVFVRSAREGLGTSF